MISKEVKKPQFTLKAKKTIFGNTKYTLTVEAVNTETLDKIKATVFKNLKIKTRKEVLERVTQAIMHCLCVTTDHKINNVYIRDYGTNQIKFDMLRYIDMIDELSQINTLTKFVLHVD